MSTNATTDSTIREALQANGWTLTQGPSLAQKDFDTAVGVKTATVWISPMRAGTIQRLLSGEYYSEGRNILGPHCVLIPVDADSDTAAELTLQFVRNVESAIADSYAVRLLRS